MKTKNYKKFLKKYLIIQFYYLLQYNIIMMVNEKRDKNGSNKKIIKIKEVIFKFFNLIKMFINFIIIFLLLYYYSNNYLKFINSILDYNIYYNI